MKRHRGATRATQRTSGGACQRHAFSATHQPTCTAKDPLHISTKKDPLPLSGACLETPLPRLLQHKVQAPQHALVVLPRRDQGREVLHSFTHMQVSCAVPVGSVLYSVWKGRQTQV